MHFDDFFILKNFLLKVEIVA